MSFTQHGNQDYEFGFHSVEAAAIATAIGLKPQTLSLGYEPEFRAEAQDENGEVATVVLGPRKIAFTMNGYVVDETLLKAAEAFEYDGRYFIIENLKIDESNTDFKKAELTGNSWLGIEAPAP